MTTVPLKTLECCCPHEDCGITFTSFGVNYGETTCCPGCGRQQAAQAPKESKMKGRRKKEDITEEKPKGRLPDYTVSALSKRTEYKGGVGVAWKQEDGRISIKLNAFVVLDASEDLSLTLFPFKKREHAAAAEEIPF